jgi:hypothetical protein
MITSIDDFKNFLISLVRGIVSAGDAKLAAYKVQIDTLSADLTIANETIAELKSAIAANDLALAAIKVETASTQVAALDQLSTDLAAEFNPTLTADAVSETVTVEPAIETPVEVTEATEIGTSEPTPEAVVESAIVAIEEAGADLE